MLKAHDENQNENDYRFVMQMIKEFPDPYDYIIGFHLATFTD